VVEETEDIDVMLDGLTDPHSGRMVYVRLGVDADTCKVTVEDVVSRGQELRILKDHLDAVLVAMELGARRWVGV
jgi:hypothetical protein